MYFLKTLRSAALLVALCPFVAFGADASYNFNGGIFVPTVNGDTGGVTFSNFSVNSLDVSGGANGVIRIKGQGLGNDSRAAFDGGRFLSFTVTVPSSTTVNFKSMTMSFSSNYASGSFTNARVFSDIQGDDSLAGDTIGVAGKSAGDTTGAGTDTLNLLNPTTNSGKGGNITANDFLNLTNRAVTFRFPWISSSNSASDYIEISSLTFSYDLVSAPPAAVTLKVTDFKVAADHSAKVDFMGPESGPYALMACADLTGPVYRKRWERLAFGDFGSAAVSYSDVAAIHHPKRFYVVAGSQRPVAKIMPVGDSITAGAGTFVVYRPGLYDQLTAAGYHFQFIGSYGTDPLKHEGVGGNNPTMVASRLAGVFPSNPADIVIIHAGHNMNVNEDVLDSAGTAAVVATVETATRSMITTCRTTNPKVRIVLSKVIPAGKMPKYSYIPALNVRLGEIAAELNNAAQPVIIVDQEAGFNWETDTITADKVHPNEFGAAKMAAKYFSALVPLLE